MDKVTHEFAACWQAAAKHLEGMGQAGMRGWLKVDLIPPFLENLSFRLGNQLFFIRIEDVDGRLPVPGNPNGLLAVADGCKGHACTMRMRKISGAWTVGGKGWGLVDARTGIAIDPPALVTDERIEMTDWELQDFAVQIVRDQLKTKGLRIASSQGNPAVDPSLWFVGAQGPEWVVVRAVRYPALNAQAPANWAAIAASCARQTGRGNFASVAIVSAAQDWAPGAAPTPLWRGQPNYARFTGLQPKHH